MRYALWDRRAWMFVSTLAVVGCGARTGDGGPAPGDDATAEVVRALEVLPPATEPARQLAPLSGSVTGSPRPVLKWTGPNVAAIQICADHGCRRTLSAFIATGHRGRPLAPLPTGVAYWRLITVGPRLTVTVSPTWELFVPPGGSNANAARGLRYDADADGYADAAVRDHDGSTGIDLLHVYSGGVGGLSATRVATVTLDATDFRGSFTTAAGDVNGDGYGDVAVSDDGGVVVYAGSAAGVVATPLSVTPAPAGDNGSSFGFSLAALGDVNGDGYGDLAVDDGFKLVWVFLGGPSGLGATASWVLDRSAVTDRFVRLLTSGDLDGDGFGDLVVTDYGPDGTPQGFRYFRGGAAGLEDPAAGTFVVRPNFPSGIAGDVDGDGTIDLVTSEVTALALFRGGAGFPAAPVQTIAVVDRPLPIQAGDFDGDGDTDLAAHAGTPTSDITVTADRIDIYTAGPAGLSPTPTQTIDETAVLPDNILNFGVSLANADFDRDGREDLLAGAPAPFPPHGATAPGAAFVFPGTASGVSPTPAPRLDGSIGFGVFVSAGIPQSGD